MSGVLAVVWASLLMPQAAPHPSTLGAYQAPAIRPFEPSSDFGRTAVEGDSRADLSRRPLTGPVTVEAYTRSYEFTPSDADTGYDHGVTSAEIRTDQSAGALDGRWAVVASDGTVVFHLVISDPGQGLVEGGWRSGARSGAATYDGRTLTLEGRAALTLERTDQGWRGVPVDGGRALRLIRPH